MSNLRGRGASNVNENTLLQLGFSENDIRFINIYQEIIQPLDIISQYIEFIESYNTIIRQINLSWPRQLYLINNGNTPNSLSELLRLTSEDKKRIVPHIMHNIVEDLAEIVDYIDDNQEVRGGRRKKGTRKRKRRIHTKTLHKRGGNQTEQECGICYQETRLHTMKPCNHKICERCFDQLMRSTDLNSPILCPFCRSKVKQLKETEDQGRTIIRMNTPLTEEEKQQLQHIVSDFLGENWVQVEINEESRPKEILRYRLVNENANGNTNSLYNRFFNRTPPPTISYRRLNELISDMNVITRRIGKEEIVIEYLI